MRVSIPLRLKLIVKDIDAANGRAILVGGYVRDELMNVHSDGDFDVEVFGLEWDKLKEILESHGKVTEAGASFGVLKLTSTRYEMDFSIPRTERKVGEGHGGFETEFDPDMSFEDAALRRDLTINAIGYDPISRELLDPYNGIQDIKDCRIRHVSDRFAEDPLRVLRIAQFAARFEYSVDEETIELCKTLVEEMKTLPRERFFAEFKKLLLKSDMPSIGLIFLDRCGAIDLFPELKALQGTLQNPEWHPEGDVWVHSLMVTNEATKLRTGDEKHDLVLMFGALCHDLGKPAATIWKDEKWRSPGHEEMGEEPTRSFLERLTNDTELTEQVVAVVRDHLKPTIFYGDKVSMSAIRRLALRVDIPMLIKVAQADQMGRTHWQALARDFPAGPWLLKKYKQLDIRPGRPKNSIEPILKGRHLLKLGMKPGPDMGVLLQEAFEEQLNGGLDDEDKAILWATSRISK